MPCWCCVALECLSSPSAFRPCGFHLPKLMHARRMRRACPFPCLETIHRAIRCHVYLSHAALVSEDTFLPGGATCAGKASSISHPSKHARPPPAPRQRSPATLPRASTSPPRRVFAPHAAIRASLTSNRVGLRRRNSLEVELSDGLSDRVFRPTTSISTPCRASRCAELRHETRTRKDGKGGYGKERMTRGRGRKNVTLRGVENDERRPKRVVNVEGTSRRAWWKTCVYQVQERMHERSGWVEKRRRDETTRDGIDG